jgi:RNA-dependent RNA polymerase
LNFHVVLFKDKSSTYRRHRGIGALTFSTEEIGLSFLARYGVLGLAVKNHKIKFTPSKKRARPDVVESITLRPFIDPEIAERKERLDQALQSYRIKVRTLQFGWWCRDDVFSIEWEYESSMALSFNDDQRECRLAIPNQSGTQFDIAIRFSQISELVIGMDLQDQPVATLTLETVPSFESRDHSSDKRKRLSYLPISHHQDTVSYISMAIRLICSSKQELDCILDCARLVQLRHTSDSSYSTERRGLFAPDLITKVRKWLRALNWSIAFQVQSLLNTLSVDMEEMLALLPHIYGLKKKESEHYAAEVVRHFIPWARDYVWNPQENTTSLTDVFFKAESEYRAMLSKATQTAQLEPLGPNLFKAYHAIVTPTGLHVEGPFVERSNRVIRTYDQAMQKNFLRVSFVEEGRLQFRFDKDIDATDFIRQRVGDILLNGLIIASRKFDFLAYSQSALKEHSVW